MSRRESSEPPNDASAHELARAVARELRFGIEGGEPQVIAAALELERLLAGSVGAFSPVDSALPTPNALSALALRLEQELLSGRFLVRRERTSSLTERRDVGVPDLPPLPPAPRETGTSSFEVRFVDEVGKAISGVDAEFTADGPRTRPTNAAGIALLEGVQTSRADVSLLDPEALEKVLDPRWATFRPGKPPKESNTREVVFRGSSLGPFVLTAELPHTVVIKPPLGKLFVELFDKTGRVRHAHRSYQITGPRTFEGTTDDAGRLLHEGVFPGDYQLSLGLDFFEEGDPDRAMDVVESSLVVLDASEGEPQVRMLGAVPRSVLARLHGFFNVNKSFLLPTALPSVRQLRKLYSDNAPCKLLVVGHADTRGGAAYNDKLSLERAEATIAYLRDDVEAWFKFYSHDDPNQRWGKVEDHLMIIALPDFRSKPSKEDEVSFFQRTRKLKVDGKAGKDTRHALIAEYMSLDGTSLQDFVGEIEAVAHGCGENFPLDDRGEALDAAPADEKADHVDRRVELFFFDAEFGITPPPPGKNSPPASKAYPKWRERAVEVHDLVIDAAGTKLQLVELEDVLFDTNSAVPLPAPCEPGGRGVAAKGPSALTDVAAALRFAFCYPDKLVLVAGHADTTADASVNDPLSEQRARSVLALLVGDRSSFSKTCDARHVKADQSRVLDWADSCLGFACAPKRFGGSTDKAVRAFQEAYNASDRGGNTQAPPLRVDGAFGALTWASVFDLFEGQIAELLDGDRELLDEYRASLNFVDEDKRSMGFGERYPIDELGRDGIRSAANRRVEVLFFDAKDKPDLDAPLDLSDIYLPGGFVREPQPVNPDTLQPLPLQAARLPTRFSNGRTFPKPSALPVLRQMAKLATEGHARLVIVGHTDHSLLDAENEKLALGRAEAVSALLRQDKGFFLRRFNQPDPIKVWNWEEVQWMLSAVRIGDERCYVGMVDDYPGDITRAALGRFQLDSGELDVDYGCDIETLSLLIDRYFDLLGTRAVAEDRIRCVSAGSWNPPRGFSADATAEDLDGELSGTNRRVDVFAFDQPVVPAVETVVPSTRIESPTYVRWCRATGLELKDAPMPFPLRLFDPQLVVIGGVTLSMTKVDDETGQLAAQSSLTTSEFGSAEFVGEVGSYQLSFSARGRDYAFGVSVQPDEFGGFAAVISQGSSEVGGTPS